MVSIEDWVKAYDLQPHPEGGYFKQVLKSSTTMTVSSDIERALYTSIYFLLTNENPSRFHRLRSDEVWYYHYGTPLTIHMIDDRGEYQHIQLGPDFKKGQTLQAIVPKGIIFGSSIDAENGYALVSCMVSPGFEFDDFELIPREELIEAYPAHREIIQRLTF